jgi:hypothetical protein
MNFKNINGRNTTTILSTFILHVTNLNKSIQSARLEI